MSLHASQLILVGTLAALVGLTSQILAGACSAGKRRRGVREALTGSAADAGHGLVPQARQEARQEAHRPPPGRAEARPRPAE